MAGTALVERVCDLLRGLEIDGYANHGQMALKDLYPGTGTGQHLEIDLLGKVADCGILIEVTSQKNKNNEKIKQFVNHCRLFLDSPAPLKERLRLFQGLPKSKLSDFAAIEDWRFLYIGTSSELIENSIKPTAFPAAKGNLFILNNDDFIYLLALEKLIGAWARYEFLSAIKIDPSTTGDVTLLEKSCMRFRNRIVTGGSTRTCDLLLLSFTPEELLKAGRIFRYGGLPILLEGAEEVPEYQRMLILEKLRDIAKFIGRTPKKTFPNTVTLVLRKSQVNFKSDTKVTIPIRYGSIDIVDGQHRVFGYAASAVSQRSRKEGRLLATAIVLDTDNIRQANKLAARIFWEINSRQTRVKRDLLYLIKYDVLGDTDAEAIAGEILRQCNQGGKALGQLFKTHPLRKKNKFNNPPIPIVTIVEELSTLLRTGPQGITAKQFYRLYRLPGSQANRQHKKLIARGRVIVEKYFSAIETTFPEDWREGSNSALLSSKYLAACVRLLRLSLLDDKFDFDRVKRRLEGLRSNLRPEDMGEDKPTFPRDSKDIPTTKDSVKNIFEFLRNKLSTP